MAISIFGSDALMRSTCWRADLRRPSAPLLLALLLVGDPALGAGFSAPRAEYAANASSQCNGTTSPACGSPGRQQQQRRQERRR